MTQSVPRATAESAKNHPIVTLIGFIGSLAAIYAVIHALSPDPVERPLAEQFLVHYYTAATRNPKTCCLNELDHTYLSAHPDVPRDYVAFFSRFKSIDVSHVRDVGDGYFRAYITYHSATDGSTSSETDRFRLVCSKWTEIPGMGCGVDDVKIDDVTNHYH
jgi:hypothetical protein